ncbi:MAG: cytochrome c oxidase subunit 3 [Deltaproteobacteria bacterium]
MKPAAQPVADVDPGTGHEGSVFYPPGGLMVWIFIVLELITFGAAICIFVFEGTGEAASYAAARRTLDVPLATVNTLALLTSGFFAAMGVAAYKEPARRASSRWMLGAAAFGTLFVALKLTEYRAKLSAGHGMGSSTFFSFYWVLTGFHLLHVVLGIAILLYLAVRVRSVKPFESPDLGLETGVAFWHMCDLIWVMLFPVIYLVR